MINPNKPSIPGAIIVEGHVQGLSNTRSLGVNGIPVYIVDISNCIASSSRYCKKFFICPDYISDDFVPFLIELAKREQIKGWVIIPSNDHAVLNISKHKEMLQQYYKIITADFNIVSKIYDKSLLLGIAINNKIPVPRTQYFLTPNDVPKPGLSFPLITKGKHGLSFYKAIGKKAFLAYNVNELKFQLNQIAEVYDLSQTFTQELILFDGSNKTVSFTAFCIDGEIKAFWMGLKLREHPLQFGTATYAKSVYIPEIYKQSIILLKELNYSGVCEVEYLLDPRSNEYKLIEINARTWLWVGLAKDCGVDYAMIVYNYINNMDVIYPKEYNTNRYWINPFTDMVYSIIGIIKGKVKFRDYFSSLFRKKTSNALFQKDDLKPGFAYLFNAFSFLKTR